MRGVIKHGVGGDVKSRQLTVESRQQIYARVPPSPNRVRRDPIALVGAERCALAAGVVLLVLDLFLLKGRGGLALVAAGALILAISGLLGLILRWGFKLLEPVPVGRPLRCMAGAALTLPLIIVVSWLLFQGTGISTRWYAPYGPLITAPLIYLGVAISLYLMGRLAHRATGWGRLVLLPPVAAWSLFFYWADRLLYPHQYGYLHWILLLLLWLGAAAAAWLLLGFARQRWAEARLRWLILTGVSLVLVIGVGILPVGETKAWRKIEQVSHSSGRLLEVARRMADLDGDQFSVILGEEDCDNTEARVHPFAREVPGNGIDEDCDGQDSVPPAPVIKDSREESISVKEYRTRLAAWKQTAAPKAWLEQTKGYNVVLIVVDALRADFLQPLAAVKTRYPNLAGLLSQSSRFSTAFSSAAGTDLGMTTMLTGVMRRSSVGRRTLPGAFRQSGARTYGIYQREVRRWLNPMLPRIGLWGRKEIINDPEEEEIGTRATSKQVSNIGLRFLRRYGKGRFFLWLHYFDVHEHHQINQKTLSLPLGLRGERPVGQRAKYQLMLQHVDHHVGRFLRGLERLGLAKKTIVVLAADHGEGLAETPRLPAHHGALLYQPLVHVPFGFRIPGKEGRLIRSPATVADLYPTLLDLAGVRHGHGDGISLVPLLFEERPSPFVRLSRPIYMMESRQNAVVLWPLKLIAWKDKGRVELYDLSRDPGEVDDLAPNQPKVARRLAAMLQARSLAKVDRLGLYKARRWRKGAPDEPGQFPGPTPSRPRPVPPSLAPGGKAPDRPDQNSPGQRDEGDLRQKEQDRGQSGNAGKEGREGQGKTAKDKTGKGRRGDPGQEEERGVTDEEPGAPGGHDPMLKSREQKGGKERPKKPRGMSPEDHRF